MTQHTERFGNGFVTYSTVDAEFQFEGKLTYMEFHNYCGPMFYTKLSEEEYETEYERLILEGKTNAAYWLSHEQWLEPDDSDRWAKLWKEFTKWQEENNVH